MQCRKSDGRAAGLTVVERRLRPQRSSIRATAGTAETAGTAGTAGTTEPTGTVDDEGRVPAESTSDGVTRSPGRLDVGTEARESGPARVPKRVGSGHLQVSAPVSIEEVDVDREPATESGRGVRDDDQAIVVVRPEVVRPEVVLPEVVLPEELSVVDRRAVLEDRDVLDTRIRTAPATVGGEIRTGGSGVDVDGPDVRGG
jgi:hypothetical protein